MTNQMILWLLFQDATKEELASYKVTEKDLNEWLSTFFSEANND